MRSLTLIWLISWVAIVIASQCAPNSTAAGWSAPSGAILHPADSLLLAVKKKGGDFFESPTANGRSLCINDPSNKQKETLYKRCAKLNGNAKCFLSIAQCCCFYKPK